MAGFEAHAIVELMGHQTIAGKVTEETLFGVAMMRVDVPETKSVGAFTRYYGASSIYCIRPTTEEIAKAAAERFEERPVQNWLLPTNPLLASKVVEEYDDEPDYDPENDDDGFGLDYDDDQDLDDDDPYDDDPNEAAVPDALTASRMLHLPKEEDYSDADDRPIPGAPDPANDYKPYDRPVSTLSDKERAIRRAKELMTRKFIIFDTETTGFNDDDEIIQIAIINETGETVLKSYIKPTKPITNSQYHGITDEMVKNAPTYPEIHAKLAEAMNGNLWLAYNAEYDERVLHQVNRKHNIPDPLGSSRTECIMLLYADFYGDWNSYHGNNRWQKLSEAMSQCGLKWDGEAHDAEADCKATLAVLKAMAATEPVKTE